MNVYGVIFRDKGKSYYFNGHDLKIPNRVTVIVETEKGEQFGRVINKLDNDKIKNIKTELKSILRIATKKDYEQYLNNLKDAKKALDNARKISSELNLDMNFVDSSFTFDRKQLLFNFYADERVDFRELAKRLAAIYHTRIELRQIGARDKAEHIGGIGVCGRSLCCASCLNHLDSVTMTMAKNQNLALNPSKINGVCGRLLCCLAYEDEQYIESGKDMPSIGEEIASIYGKGKVVSIDILNKKYKILVDDEIKEIVIGENE